MARVEHVLFWLGCSFGCMLVAFGPLITDDEKTIKGVIWDQLRRPREALLQTEALEARARALGTSRGYRGPRFSHSTMGPTEGSRLETDAELLERVENLERCVR